MTIRACFVCLSLAVLAGCGTEIPPEPPAPSPPPAPVATEAPTATPVATPASETPAPAEPAAASAEPAAPAPVPAAEPAVGPELAPPAQAQPAAAETPTDAVPADMERVKAERGVGLKGRSLDEHQGMLVTPAKAYFSVRERVVFNIQIPDALNKFKAINGNGPKSHDEFMAQIVEANQIQLPELPAGQRYVYDPQQEELMVERPR